MPHEHTDTDSVLTWVVITLAGLAIGLWLLGQDQERLDSQRAAHELRLLRLEHRAGLHSLDSIPETEAAE